MIDINALINNAIASAVDARIAEVLQQHANIVGAMAERIATLEGQIAAATPQVEFTERQHNAFVDHLNNQEWFWNKVNSYVDRHIDHGEYISKEDFQELFDEALADADLDDPVREVLRNVSVSLDL